jgi:hydrogenase maturation protease
VTGTIRRFAPDIVILLDALEMGKTPGEIALFAAETTDGLSASTHSLPLSLLSTYLTSELGCQVWLLGVQIAQVEMNQPMSEPVQFAYEYLVDELEKIFR